ncbi:MazF family transcriptional regulator [Frankia canadensis]|uniref:MazF family transcriptional regulator n=1 Tax=Frankia canadensis TaxID=1836972 RepID=A0A2I2KP28_9ACTN|nr:type II toxin-antitoxin system PemK/MazF family toxin [Frankia canadensis]SNQ47428.1 MazF family transcriptional regulator [Frankia canadensis]SOU54718.1 MazF family transcriptional regulator [Frankia canadensis]
MRCGEVWWADFGERRPVVLLSEPSNATFQAMHIVEPATVDITGVGLEVALGSADGLPLEGVVRVAFPRPGRVPCTWLTTVTEQDLIERAGALSESKVGQIREALRLSEVLPQA